MSWDEQVAVRTLWGEARGEPEDGQLAVAHVLLNRRKAGKWGPTLAAVCLSRLQFSCWNASDPNRELMAVLAEDGAMFQRLKAVLERARVDNANGKDPTGGATHYYSTSMKDPPNWSKGATMTGQFGKHRFFRGVL